eukprot:3812364-Pleurochrysis_carterae.AAC.1
MRTQAPALPVCDLSSTMCSRHPCAAQAPAFPPTPVVPACSHSSASVLPPPQLSTAVGLQLLSRTGSPLIHSGNVACSIGKAGCKRNAAACASSAAVACVRAVPVAARGQSLVFCVLLTLQLPRAAAGALPRQMSNDIVQWLMLRYRMGWWCWRRCNGLYYAHHKSITASVMLRSVDFRLYSVAWSLESF